MPSAYDLSIGDGAGRRGEVGDVESTAKDGKGSVCCRSALVGVSSVPQKKFDWWSIATAIWCSSALLVWSAGACCGVKGAASGLGTDEFGPESKIGRRAAKEASTEAILLRLDVALSAAENIMVASSALIKARPGGRE
jgi:hypothetical protein